MPGCGPVLGQERQVRPLLEYLAATGCDSKLSWKDWQISRITGGRNNLLYRARGPRGDLAIKFTVPDERDRAGREYGALYALRQAGLSIAPRPILLDRSTYEYPVVVESWIDGHVTSKPPTSMAQWRRLLEHLALVHTITPADTRLVLRKSALHASSAEEGKLIVQCQAAHIPESEQDPELQALMERLQATHFPDWAPPPVTLCRLDNNITNYVQRPGPWASVDWEYSGWGDPGFDVANLLTHVAYLSVPTSQWSSAAAIYCDLAQDSAALERIQVYCQILVVWWAARLACYLYELPREMNRRLAEWSEGWQEDIQAKYQHYLQLAGLLGGQMAVPWSNALAHRPA